MVNPWLDISSTVTVQTGPTVEPVSLAAAKRSLRLETSADDDLVGFLIQAAREYVERIANRSLITQTLDLTFDEWPGDKIELPRGPVQSVTSVTSYTTADAAAVMSAADYRVDTTTDPGRIALKDGAVWPSDLRATGSAGVVRYVTGYGATIDDSVPAPLRQAIVLLVGHWYETTSVAGPNLSVLPFGFDAAIAPYRIPAAG
jgi:uncharacterized phiE125 gp8 family phage protein